MKKLVCLSMALLLCLSLTGALAENTAPMEGNVYLSGYPIVKEPETLHMFIVQPEGYPTGFEGMAQVERWAEETNIDFVWDTIPVAAWAERKAIMIASDDLPDVICGGGVSVDEQIAWAEQGLLVELTPYIENYMPRFQEILADHPEYLEQLKLPDGSIYGFGHIADIDFGQRGNILYGHRIRNNNDVKRSINRKIFIISDNPCLKIESIPNPFFRAAEYLFLVWVQIIVDGNTTSFLAGFPNIHREPSFVIVHGIVFENCTHLLPVQVNHDITVERCPVSEPVLRIKFP